MTRRILSFLALLALLAAPFGMMNGVAAAMPHAQDEAMMEHCEGMAPAHHESEGDKASVDCLIACAALPAIASDGPLDTAFAVAAPAILPLSILSGMLPEAETPPPRFS